MTYGLRKKTSEKERLTKNEHESLLEDEEPPKKKISSKFKNTIPEKSFFDLNF
jgi:hypothetical protein